ncbi:MAG: threonylcarbamoyl-AMP synthase [Nitrospirae bacterium]|nr:threonylcarbamoyl-AMP synthase [Nitrospirota bacterium]
MRIFSFKPDTAKEVLEKSLKILKAGGVIAYPTESFYALGVLAADEAAVKRLCQIKNRPLNKPLPLIVGDIEILRSVVKSVPLQTEILIGKFWPGPLTIIFESVRGLPALLTGGSDRIAVRIPGESVALHLSRLARLPITATSANPSGSVPARSAQEVIDYFGESVDLVIDAGETPGGKPSTIIDVTVTPLKILRAGRIDLQEYL